MPDSTGTIPLLTEDDAEASFLLVPNLGHHAVLGFFGLKILWGEPIPC